jgi:hypothetical protein
VLPASLHGQRFVDEIPDVQVPTLAGVGHVSTYDDPELIVETITDWIAHANRAAAPRVNSSHVHYLFRMRLVDLFSTCRGTTSRQKILDL